MVGLREITLSGASSAQPSFIAPNVAAGGATLTFQLVASDGVLMSIPSLVNVTVKDVNHAPVADAGSNQTVSEGSAVTLNGAQVYDVDGDAITYLWQQVSGAAVILTSTTDAVVQFTAPFVTTSGDTRRFSLSVNDGVLSHTVYVDVRVDNINHAPQAHAGAD